MTYNSEQFFIPHAIILTELSVPRPIFAAAMIGADKYKRIDFDPNSRPLSYVEQALKKLPVGVPCFGLTTGFVINYSPEKAVQFDKTGTPIANLSTMKIVGQAKIRV